MSIHGIGYYNTRGYYNYNTAIQQEMRNRHMLESMQRQYGYGAGNRCEVNFIRKYSSIMSDLLASANALTAAGRSGVMNAYSVSSSNTDVASVTMEWPMHEEKDWELYVDNIARAQKNVSNRVTGNDTASSDMNFQVTGTDTISVSVNARNDDGTVKTNRQMLEEAARQINAGEAGVKASVTEHDDGTLSLEVESDETGTSNQFSVTGNLGAASGLEQTSVNAEDARYRVTSDGQTQSYTSESNDIDLELGKLKVTLTGTGRTDISVRPDMDGIVSAVEDLVKNYNKALEYLGDHAYQGTGVERQLDNLSRSPISGQSLEVLGIKRNSDGTMTFDQEVFRKSMEKDPDFTKELLTGQFGLAQRASQRAQSGLSETSESLVNHKSGGIFSTVYPDGMRTVFGGYDSPGRYNYYTLGRLFDRRI